MITNNIKGGKMMKKLLVFLVMMSVLGVMFVGADQTTIIDGEEVVDFTLTDLDFGAVIPGIEKGASSTLTLSVANNVDFDLSIYLGDASDPIFENIVLDLSNIDGSATADLEIGLADAELASVDDADVTDVSTVQEFDIDGSITIPVGSLPGERTATIVYLVTGTKP